SMEGKSETGIRTRHPRIPERDAFGGSNEGCAVEFLQDYVLGDLFWEVHQVGPVVEHAGGVGRVRSRPVAVLARDTLFEHYCVGPLTGGGPSGRRSRWTAADDRHVDPLHTNPPAAGN